MTTEDQHEIVRLRRHLADAKANLDEAAWMLKRAEAHTLLGHVEVPVTDADGHTVVTQDWKTLGPTETAQRHGAQLVLEQDFVYLTARSDLREAELEVALAEARIEAWTDSRRRERENLQRETNIALLQAAGLVEVGP